MTLKECREAAKKGLPVVHTAMVCCHRDNITYTRITQVGIDISEKGAESPFVTLLDKCGGSVTVAKPEDVVLEIDFIKMQKEKEQKETA